MPFGRENLIREISFLRRRGAAEESMLALFCELDPYNLGRDLADLDHDEAMACVVLSRWWSAQKLQLRAESRGDESVTVSVDELLSSFSEVLGTRLVWSRVARVMAWLGFSSIYATTWGRASDVMCEVPLDVMGKLRALVEVAREVDAAARDTQAGDSVPVALLVSSDGSVEDSSEACDVGVVDAEHDDVDDDSLDIDGLPVATGVVDGWPYILRDPRITRDILGALSEQWVLRDGEVALEHVRIAATGYVDASGEVLDESFEVDVGWLWDVGRSAIVPRCMKDKTLQRARTKSHAEVFTPLETVGKMVDAAEEAYLAGHKGERDMLRIRAKALEVACGEGPFLTSRYDPSTGEVMDEESRVGIYDRKYRLVVARYGVADTVDVPKKERRAASRALIRVLRTTFGAEYQGDNLLIARANAYLTWYEAFVRALGHEPLRRAECVIAARTIATTIVQADVLTGEVPFSDGALSCMGFVRGIDGSVDDTEKVAVFVQS